jgi:tRNA (guanine26-N2/guanine27-N2)-dimethyltransferase
MAWNMRQAGMSADEAFSRELGFPVKWYVEGKVRFVAPAFPTTKQGEPVAPTKSPVFYNPYSSLSRDLTVAFVRCFDKEAVVAEPLAGCGVRSIRLILETGMVKKAFLNDINPSAVKTIHRNIQYSGVAEKVDVSQGDANIFLCSHSIPGERFDYVDVDPVGAPVKFTENALRACENGGYIGVSATDLASLVGNHPKTCLRKYGVLSCRSFFPKEAAARLLAAHVVLRGTASNIAARPVLSAYHRHFIRVFFRVERGRSRCLSLLKNLGWVEVCSCLYHSTSPLLSHPSGVCRRCGGKTSTMGPAWLGDLNDSQIARRMLERSEDLADASKVLKAISEELSVVGYYPVALLAKAVRTQPPSPTKLVEKLEREGFKASLTHFDPTAVKTDAPADELLRLCG